MQVFITVPRDKATEFESELKKLGAFERTKRIKSDPADHTVLFKIHKSNGDEMQKLSVIQNTLNK
tara:strand:+ start:2519 stop:2713 length:195 start_codon:yes stop_codon:yes gene_type:complete